MIVVGLLGERETEEKVAMEYGIFKGGPWSYFGYQLLAAVTISAWAALTTFIQVRIYFEKILPHYFFSDFSTPSGLTSKDHHASIYFKGFIVTDAKVLAHWHTLRTADLNHPTARRFLR